MWLSGGDQAHDRFLRRVPPNTYKASSCQEDAAVASRGRGGSRGKQKIAAAIPVFRVLSAG